MAEPNTTPAPSVGRAAFTFILIMVTFDFLAFGIIAPVLPDLIRQFEGGDFARASNITGYFGFAWATMQFIFSPILGAWSDRFGRRPVILISCFGLGIDYVFMALAPSLTWLFVGRIISGITTSNVPTAFAYITDVTPPEERAKPFGLISAAFGLGFVIGPALGGYLGNINLRFPFWAAAALSLGNALYGYFVLPESLPRERRSKSAWHMANPLGSLTLLRSHPQLFGLATVMTLFYLAQQSLPADFVLYTQYRYAWIGRDVGLALRRRHQYEHRLWHPRRPLRSPLRRAPQRPIRPDLRHTGLLELYLRSARLDVSLCHSLPRPLGHRRPLCAISDVASRRSHLPRQTPRRHQQRPRNHRHDRSAPLHPSARHRHFTTDADPFPRGALFRRRAAPPR